MDDLDNNDIREFLPPVSERLRLLGPEHTMEAQAERPKTEVHKKLEKITSEIVFPLLKISDAGETLKPIDIGELRNRIMIALGRLYFSGLEE